jgi:hypothetical protein
MSARSPRRSGNSPAHAEKIILRGDRERLSRGAQIRTHATCQRDEFSFCTSKFESDHPSHAVGLSWKTRPSQFAAGRGAGSGSIGAPAVKARSNATSACSPRSPSCRPASWPPSSTPPRRPVSLSRRSPAHSDAPRVLARPGPVCHLVKQRIETRHGRTHQVCA